MKFDQKLIWTYVRKRMYLRILVQYFKNLMWKWENSWLVETPHTTWVIHLFVVTAGLKITNTKKIKYKKKNLNLFFILKPLPFKFFKNHHNFYLVFSDLQQTFAHFCFAKRWFHKIDQKLFFYFLFFWG